MGTSDMRDTGYITKKLARIDVQSTRRIEVTRASMATPAMSKRKRSPIFKPRVLAKPSSRLKASGSSGTQAPATMLLCAGAATLCDTLNSRSTNRLARSSV